MRNAILRSTRPLLIAALVAGACNAMAAQRVDLASVNLNAPGLAAKNVFTLTGLAADELSLQYVEKLDGKNVSRFQQFYRGIPVLGESIVIKGFGDPQNNAPILMSGTILRNLAQDLPAIKPLVSEKTALDLAKTQSRTQNISAEKVNLYIRQGANGAAHLVYVVSFKNDSAASASRPSYLIDATSGAVLDNWEAQEESRKFGPGNAYKNAFAALAQMPGWSLAKASQVIGYARDVYWTEGSKMNQGACGVEKAAADLGFKVADVTAAFNMAAACHGMSAVDASAVAESVEPGNVFFGNIVRVEKVAPPASASGSSRLRQSTVTTGTLGTSTGWVAVNDKVNSLGSHGNLDFAQNRFTYLNGSAPTRPIGVCFNDYFIQTGGGTNPCNHVSGWNDLAMHYIGTGTYTKNTAYTAWSAVPGYNSIVRRNYLSTNQKIGGELTYQQITATGTNWSVATSAGLKVTEKLSVPLVEETSVEVSVGITSTVGGHRDVTQVENYYTPVVVVPPGKAVRYTVKERWQPVRTVWSVPAEFTGTVGADYGSGKWNGHYFWGLNAASYFYEYGNRAGAEKATVIVDQKKYHDITIVAEIIN